MIDLWGLTEKEAEVMGLIANGLDCKQISQKLNIAHATVRNHVFHSKRKMGKPHTTAKAAVMFYCALKGYE